MTRVVTPPEERVDVARRTTRHDRLLLSAPISIGLALPTLSTVVGLYDSIQHWGKLVHAVDGFCATFVFGLLLLGWREATRIDLADELTALTTVFGGILFGVLWEIVEFIRDWVAYSDLQKSNSDTMTDFLCNDLASVLAMLLVAYLYRNWLSAEDRRALGSSARWLVDGPSRVLNRHGIALTVAVIGLIAAVVASLWFAGRPVPGIPIP